MNAETLAELHNAIRHLVTAVANASLYRPDHPQVQRLCAAARGCFAHLLRERQRLSLMMVEGEILFDNFPLSQGLHEQKLAQLLEGRQVNRLLVSQGLDAGELVELVICLARKNLPQPPPAARTAPGFRNPGRVRCAPAGQRRHVWEPWGA